MPVDAAPLLAAASQEVSDDCGDADSDATFAICRICHTGGKNESPRVPGLYSAEAKNVLLSPCLCTGSVQYVHRSCLEEWRARGIRGSVRRAAFCELCDFPYRYELRRPWRIEALAETLLKAFCFTVPFVGIAWFFAEAYESKEVGLLTSGSFLGIWAVLDARCLVIASLTKTWPGGIGSNAMLHLRMYWRASKLLGAGTTRASQRNAVSEASAQVLASSLAQATVASWDLNSLESEAARGPQVLMPPADEEIMNWCSLQCVVEMCVFLAIPPLLSLCWWVLFNLCGLAGLKVLAIALCTFGASYASILFIVLIGIAVVCPPAKARLSPDGLPIVRSLCAEERGSLHNLRL
mmetsp:Transcript_7993/g.17817  ORF Transcript_7993/g.17817 Transcript_7993/m.17817 type:complete len:351 (-) Transcript_7993:238-1290(-)